MACCCWTLMGKVVVCPTSPTRNIPIHGIAIERIMKTTPNIPRFRKEWRFVPSRRSHKACRSRNSPKSTRKGKMQIISTATMMNTTFRLQTTSSQYHIPPYAYSHYNNPILTCNLFIWFLYTGLLDRIVNDAALPQFLSM